MAGRPSSGSGRIGRPPGATPRAFAHCQRVYAAMAGRSVPAVEIGDPAVPTDATAVYIGNLIPLMRSLGYTSTEQYHAVKTALVEMGCVRQLRRGTRYRVGAWALIRPPTVQAWDAAIRRPFSHKREVQLRENHRRALHSFLREVAREYPQLVGLAALELGVRSLVTADLVTYLVGRDEGWLRREFPSGELCLGYTVPGAVHTCRVPDLDPTVPSHVAGAWKRRADYLATLAAG
jgi:hypothetical protein